MRTIIAIDHMVAKKVTDDWPNTRDEIYFVPVGVGEWVYKDIHTGSVVVGRDILPLPSRISPAGTEDYFQFWKNTVRRNLPLVELDQNVSLSTGGGRAFGHRFWIDFLVFEQDNDAFEALFAASKVLATGGLNALFSDGVSVLPEVGHDVIEAVEGTGDDLIGGFRVESYRGLPGSLTPPRMAQVNWKPLDATQLIGAAPELNQQGTVYDMALPARSTATFSAKGADSDYEFTASVAVTD